MRQIRIAITMGDPAGIGPEVLTKALKKIGRVNNAAFFIIGDSNKFKPGKPNKASALASIDYLNKAVSMIKKGEANCLVTGPICKENISKLEFSWPGHTEFLADSFGVKNVEMVFVSDKLKVVLATRHVALKQAISLIKKGRIEKCAESVLKLLIENFKIKKPKIAVCGLNPHAGEAGLFGKEEINEIRPAVDNLNKLYGKYFFGPYPSDTVFYHACRGEFDLVVAMYHDQGLIPFKMFGFNEGVNLTAGLPFIRTSPVHGTAFDIAGKNIADYRSMMAAIKLACKLTKNL